MRTIGSILKQNKGIGPGFDFLRIALALMVVLNHSFLLMHGDYHFFQDNNLQFIFDTPVPMFFALSGFLVAGSAQRLKLRDFLLNRGLRIAPALIMVILVSAFILGPILSTEPPSQYFTDRKFFSYLLNIIGDIHYELPGVFLQNPHPIQVNGSLWTVPFEILCYTLISLLVVSKIINSPLKIVLFSIVFCCFYIAIFILVNDNQAYLNHSWPFMEKVFGKLPNDKGVNLCIYFLFGCIFHDFRNSIPHSKIIAILSVLTIGIVGDDFLSFGVLKHIVMAPAAGYLVIFLGVIQFGKIPIYSKGDYSYGVYLYAYPIQQALVLLCGKQITVVVHFILSAVFATGVAMISWHGIERPILKIRKKFSYTARKGEAHPSLPPNFSMKNKR